LIHLPSFDAIGPAFAARPGGYTRIIKLAKRRLGDSYHDSAILLPPPSEPKAAGDYELGTVTYGGQTMTKVVDVIVGTSYRAYAAAFYLDEAGIAAASGSSFVVTWSDYPNRTPVYSSVFLQGVDQVSPIGASDTNASTSSGTISTSPLATYDGARESLTRLQSFGINAVYTHNYGCQPGSHLSFAEILRAADNVGMLVSLSQPHFGQYEWEAEDADQNNGYAQHAEFYVRVAQNHPSVVAYSMSHNATGYAEDMNPDMIDGIHDARTTWGERNAKVALRAEAIIQRLDPTRIVYHHSSGNR